MDIFVAMPKTLPLPLAKSARVRIFCRNIGGCRRLTSRSRANLRLSNETSDRELFAATLRSVQSPGAHRRHAPKKRGIRTRTDGKTWKRFASEVSLRGSTHVDEHADAHACMPVNAHIDSTYIGTKACQYMRPQNKSLHMFVHMHAHTSDMPVPT